MSTRARRPLQPPLLATVTPLPVPTVEHRAWDIVHTLRAAGITATIDQATVLAEHGMHGLGCWTPSNYLPDVHQTVMQVSRLEQATRAAQTRKDQP